MKPLEGTDIYGDSTKTISKPTLPKFDPSQLQGALASLNSLVAPPSVGDGKLRLKLVDELESYGSVRSLVMGLIDDEVSSRIFFIRSIR